MTTLEEPAQSGARRKLVPDPSGGILLALPAIVAQHRRLTFPATYKAVTTDSRRQINLMDAT